MMPRRFTTIRTTIQNAIQSHSPRNKLLNFSTVTPASKQIPSSVSQHKCSSSAVKASAGAVAELEADVEEDLTLSPLTTVGAGIDNPCATLLPTSLQPRVVIFDGVCPLCHSGVKWVISADKYKKLKFCCLQSKTAEPYMKLCDVDREDVLRRFVFIEGLGQYHQGSTAALKVLSYLPFPYSALSALSVIPTPLRDAIYDYVAKRRYNIFGKADECLVLREPDMLERFIDRKEILERLRQSDV